MTDFLTLLPLMWRREAYKGGGSVGQINVDLAAARLIMFGLSVPLREIN